MPVIKIKTTVRNAMAQQIVDALDAAVGPAKLRFYEGTMPADGDTAITTQVTLGTLTCTDPSANVAAGTITFDVITQDSSADATGTAQFCALMDADSNIIVYLDVTDTEGTGAVKLNTVEIVENGPILISSLVITVGGA